MNSTRGAPTAQTDWADQVLRFWFTELSRQQWFAGGTQLDEQVLSRFLDVYTMVAAAPEDVLLADTRTALAAVIVLDQFSRNMFRRHAPALRKRCQSSLHYPEGFGQGLWGALSSEEQLFLYLPFEHQENVDAQARSVELISALGDPELTKFAQAHKDVIDRFGQFPHRNGILGRTSTAEELEFLKGQGSSF